MLIKTIRSLVVGGFFAIFMIGSAVASGAGEPDFDSNYSSAGHRFLCGYCWK